MDELEGEFGGWLNGAMRRRGLSQAALARAVGVADTQVSRWRRGQVIPSLRYLQQIADTFGVPRHTLDRLAGYPVVAVSDAEGADPADPAAQADLEAALAHYRDTLEGRIPRPMWRAYAAACDALAEAFTAAERATREAATEDAPAAATIHEAREVRHFGFGRREVGATLVPPGMPPAPLPGGPGGPMPLPGGPPSPMPGPTDLPPPPRPLTPPTPQPLPRPLIEPEPEPPTAPEAPEPPEPPGVPYDR